VRAYGNVGFHVEYWGITGPMLDHVSITVSDIGAAEVFYDAIMAAIGVPKVRRSETRLGYGERCDSEHPDRSYLSVKLGDKPEPSYSRPLVLQGTKSRGCGRILEGGYRKRGHR
jgi:hypothetical protein